MKKLWNKWMYSLMRFMQGRYGPDAFGRFLIYSALGLSVLSLFLRNGILNLISAVFLWYEVYRMFSKNIVKRSMENRKYLDFNRSLKQNRKLVMCRLTDRKNRYYRCPECGRVVRVPKGHGKIEIRCPSCSSRFEAKS